MNLTLTEIGNKYGTDKSTFHKFTDFYDTNLKSLRDKELSLLEVGILDGNSIKMWYDYFTESIIYGVDIQDYKHLENDRIKTFVANQENEGHLRGLPKNLDIIIDDGGHTMYQQQITLKVLFLENLKSGGIFILEDLHTSLPKYRFSHGCTDENNTLKLVKDLKNGRLSDDNKYFINQTDFNLLLEQIDSVEILDLGEFPVGEPHITSIIRKK